MEHLAANNNSSSGNENIFTTMGLSHQGSTVGYLSGGGSMSSLLQHTEQFNIRPIVDSSQLSSSFTGLIHEQHYSLVHGGRLVVELNIEAPSANNLATNGAGGPTGVNDSLQSGQRCICGRKRKTSESEGTSINVDLNEIPINEEEYCECENPTMQWTGSMSPHAASSSHGLTGQQSQAGPGGGTQIRGAASSQDIENHGSSRVGSSGRSRRRGTPRRRITSVSGGSSGEIPRYEPPTIAVMSAAAPITISVAAPTAASVSVTAPLSVATQVPFRIRDIVRRDNLLHAFHSPSSFAPVQRAFGSGLGLQPLYSSSFATASLSDAQGMTLGQTSNGQNVPFAQRYPQFPNLQPDTNSQPAGSSNSNVAQNLMVNPTQQAEQLHHQPAAAISVGGFNQVRIVGPAMQSRSGANRRDPRLNVEQNINQPIGNVQPGVISNLQREIIRLRGANTVNNDYIDLQALQGLTVYQGNEVIDISDDENDELDDMRLDIEQMTYEDLLDLGERIGAVNTGLTEEVIMERLVRRYYRAAKNRPPEDAESCCICLVEFENRDVLGRINCSHKFHFDCIKQWLKEKNFCPVCKRTALRPN